MSELKINSNNIDLYNKALESIKDDNVLEADEMAELEAISTGTEDEELLLGALYDPINIVRLSLKGSSGESEANFTLDIFEDQGNELQNEILNTINSKDLLESFEYLKSRGISIDTENFNEILEFTLSFPKVNKEFLEKIEPIVDLLKSTNVEQINVLNTIVMLSQLENTELDKFMESNGGNAEEIVDTFSFMFSNIDQNTYSDLKTLIGNANSTDKSDVLATIQAYAVVKQSLSTDIGLPEHMKNGLEKSVNLLVEGKVLIDSDRQDVGKGISYYLFDNSNPDSNKVLQNSDFDIKDIHQRALLLHEVYHSYQDSTGIKMPLKDSEADAYLSHYLYILAGTNEDNIKQVITELDGQINILENEFDKAKGTSDESKANHSLQETKFMKASIIYSQAVKDHGYNSPEAQNAKQSLIKQMGNTTKLNGNGGYELIYPNLDYSLHFDGH